MPLSPREEGRTTALSRRQGCACRRRIKPRTSPSLEQRARERASSGEREGTVVQREAAAAIARFVAAVEDGLPSLAAVPGYRGTALPLLESTVSKGFIFNLRSSEFLEHCCHCRAFYSCCHRSMGLLSSLEVAAGAYAPPLRHFFL
ncbi:uncharacterized protein DS421_13g415690 [Arachis hypogaea]|nr:uncharacterized protein DS421_13g415690 [Arachis hypogaea]